MSKKKCFSCKGTGKIEVPRGAWTDEPIEVDCDVCHGTGELEYTNEDDVTGGEW